MCRWVTFVEFVECARLAIRPSVDSTESRWGQHAHNTRCCGVCCVTPCVTLVRVVLCGKKRAVSPCANASLPSFAVIRVAAPNQMGEDHPIGALTHTIRSFNSVFSPIDHAHWSSKYSAGLSRFAYGNFEKDHHRRGTEHRQPFMPAWGSVTLFSSPPTETANASQRSIFFSPSSIRDPGRNI